MQKLMSAEEFDSLAKRLPSRFAPKSVEMARLVLVENFKQAAVAELFGVNRAAVNRYVQQIRAEAKGVPGEWLAVEGYFPPEVAARLAQYALDLKVAHERGRNHRSVADPELPNPTDVC